jgi:hypothetical protein
MKKVIKLTKEHKAPIIAIFGSALVLAASWMPSISDKVQTLKDRREREANFKKNLDSVRSSIYFIPGVISITSEYEDLYTSNGFVMSPIVKIMIRDEESLTSDLIKKLREAFVTHTDFERVRFELFYRDGTQVPVAEFVKKKRFKFRSTYLNTVSFDLRK